MFYKHLTSCFYRIPFKASFFQFHCVALHALCVNVFVVPVIELLMQLVASENSVKEVRVPTIIEFEKYKGYPISSIIEYISLHISCYRNVEKFQICFESFGKFNLLIW